MLIEILLLIVVVFITKIWADELHLSVKPPLFAAIHKTRTRILCVSLLSITIMLILCGIILVESIKTGLPLPKEQICLLFTEVN